MKWFEYICYSLRLGGCVIIVVACLPFVAIGELATFISNKYMALGDRIMEKVDRITGA